MKNKELINKELDEQVGHRVYCDITGVCGCGLDKVKLHISSIRQNDVDEFISTLNKLREKYIEDACVLADFIVYDPINMLSHIKRPELRYVVANLMSTERQLSNIITHLKSIKEKI